MNTNQERSIHTIINNPEATMSRVASNSVGMAILKLKNNYFGASPSQQDIDIQDAECIAYLRALKVADFFTPNEVNIERNAKLKQDITDNLASVIDFMITKTEEPISSLDLVTLYQPDGREETLELPLKTVLSFVLKATLDDAKFAHHYEGTEAEKRQQAQQDRPKRLLTLYKCFQRAKVGICHQGVRNELGFLLNGTYEGMHLIEDTTATISYFIRNKLNLLYQKLDTAVPNSPEANALREALFQWMTEQNPSAMLTILDPTQQYLAELSAYFIANGSNPAQIVVNVEGEALVFEALVEKISSQLLFTPDTEHHAILTFINILLNANNDVPYQHTRNQALITMQNWIRANFNFNTPAHIKAVASFYSVYQAQQQLLRYQSLIPLSSSMTNEEVQHFTQRCERYFNHILTADDLLSPSEDARLHHDIDELQKVIKQCKQNSMTDSIESFFSLWFTAWLPPVNVDTLKRQYSMLLDETVQDKICLNDQTITSFKHTHIQQEDHQTFRDITPYEINRFFLHAILIKPQNWTPLFARTLIDDILPFTKNLSANSLIAQALKRDSYPETLMIQLDFLTDTYRYQQADPAQPNEPARPQNLMLLLPMNIRTAQEWIFYSFMLFNQEQRTKFYQSISTILRQPLIDLSSTYNNFISILASLPAFGREPFLIALGSNNLQAVITNTKDLCSVIRGFFETDAETFFTVLGASGLQATIKSPHDLRNALAELPNDIHMLFLTTLGLNGLKAIINDEKELDLVLIVLSEYGHASFLTPTDCAELQARIIKDEEDFNKALKKLPAEKHGELFTALGSDRLQTIFRSCWRLRDFLEKLPVTEYESFFNVLGTERLQAIIKSELWWTVRDLSTAGCEAVLTELDTYWLRHMNQPEHLITEVSALISAQKLAQKQMASQGTVNPHYDIATLIQALQSDNELTKQIAAITLACLAFNKMNQDVIREANGIGVLIPLLTSSDETTKQNVAHALDYLSRDHESNKKAIREANGIVLLCQLLGSGDQHTKKIARAALSNLRMDKTVQHKADSIHDEIVSFFSRWFTARADDVDLLKRQYAMLSDEKFRDEACLSDRTLETFNQKHIQEEEHQSFHDITQYEINRIYLHAILNKPQNWTPLFTSTLQNILSSIETIETNSIIDQSLDRNTFQKSLISQLQFLQKVQRYQQGDATQQEQPERPKRFMILLPDDVCTITDWLHISPLLQDEQREAVYQRIHSTVLQQPLLIQYIEGKCSRLTRILVTLPLTARESLFTALGADELKAIIKDIYDLYDLLNVLKELPTTSYGSLIAAFNDDKFTAIINKAYEFSKIFPDLPITIHGSLLTALGAEKLRAIIKNIYDFTSILKELSPIEYDELFNLLGKKGVIAILQGRRNPEETYFNHSIHGEIRLLLIALSAIECSNTFLTALADVVLTTSVHNADDLANLINNLPDKYCEVFLQKLGADKIYAFMMEDHDDNLADFLEDLPARYYAPFFTALGHDKLHLLIPDEDFRDRVLRDLNGDQSAAFLAAYNSTVQAVIPSDEEADIPLDNVPRF